MSEKNESISSRLIKRIKKYFDSPKIRVIILLVVGFFVIGFGAWNMLDNIKSPFIVEKYDGSLLDTAEKDINKLAELKTKDTDNDGLSDYVELYVYNTSPYLEDTDSDGYTDRQEIETSNDPLCPAGENCLATTQEDNSSIANDLNSTNFTQNNISANDLRALLIKNGLDQEQVNQIDDQTLLKLYQESTIKAESNTKSTTLTDNKQNEELKTELNNLSPEEIRQAMIDSGVPTEELNQISDEELMKYYQQALKEQNL